MAKNDWCRSPGWTREDQEEFERRLRRASSHFKPWYLTAKARSLGWRGDDDGRAAAHVLLERVIREYPDRLSDLRSAHEALGELYEIEGLLDLAEHQYQECLTVERSMLGYREQGLADLKLVEMIVRASRFQSYEYGYSLALETWNERYSQGYMLNSLRFRLLVAMARLASRLENAEDAATCAGAAIEIARVTRPQFPRHPTVGLVEADTDTLEEMQSLAKATNFTAEARGKHDD